MSRIPIKIMQVDGKTKLIGHFDEKDKTLYIRKKKSVHFYNKTKSWAVDAAVFTTLVEEHQMAAVHILDIESGTRYYASVDAFLNHSTFLNFKPFGLQRFLSEFYWTVTR